MTKKFKPRNAHERLYNKPLTGKEVFEMDNSLTQFFKLLIEIDKEQRKSKK